VTSTIAVAAVTSSNRLPGDSHNHLDTMRFAGRELAELGARTLDAWPEDRPPLRLLSFGVLGLFGSGAGRRMLGITLANPMQVRGLAVDLTNPDDRLAPLFALCAERNVFVATSAIECHPSMSDHLFHTGFIIGPSGLVLRSPKVWARSGPSITLLHSIQESYESIFGSDSIVPVTETEIGRLACVVEAEIHEPGALDLLRERRPEIICHPALRTGEHAPAVDDAHLAAAASLSGALLVSGCSAYETIDDNAGGWVTQPFAAGSTIWHPTIGLVEGPADAELGSLAWSSHVVSE
jgi:hypothetical protein